MGLKFRFKSCETLCFLRDIGSGFHTYGGQVGLHEFVCAEAYSVCCQGDQQGENYSSLT